MREIIFIALAFFAGALLYSWRRPIIRALRRFDARNAARRNEELLAPYDSLAHYRQTLRLAEEQVEEIAEVAAPGPGTETRAPRFLFQGIEYAERGEAEAARQAAVVEKARAFYLELDSLMLNRRSPRAPDRESPALPPRRS